MLSVHSPNFQHAVERKKEGKEKQENKRNIEQNRGGLAADAGTQLSSAE